MNSEPCTLGSFKTVWSQKSMMASSSLNTKVPFRLLAMTSKRPTDSGKKKKPDPL